MNHFLQEDTQQLFSSDVGEQITNCTKRGDNRQGFKIAIDVPATAASCQEGSSNEEGGDDEVADRISVPAIVDEKSGGQKSSE